MFMLANALVQVSGCIPDIICVAQITLKFVDHALIVDNRQSSILRKCRTKFDCLIFEMLFIKELKPGLNTQKDSVRAKLFR